MVSLILLAFQLHFAATADVRHTKYPASWAVFQLLKGCRPVGASCSCAKLRFFLKEFKTRHLEKRRCLRGCIDTVVLSFRNAYAHAHAHVHGKTIPLHVP